MSRLTKLLTPTLRKGPPQSRAELRDQMETEYQCAMLDRSFPDWRSRPQAEQEALAEVVDRYGHVGLRTLQRLLREQPWADALAALETLLPLQRLAETRQRRREHADR